MNAMTRQDLLTVTEGAKNKIIERLVTKYDVQAACDNSRDRILAAFNALHIENQAALRQSNATRDQLWRKTAALEGQVIGLQQEIRVLQQLIGRLADQQQPR
jgi:hypothetical protein